MDENKKVMMVMPHMMGGGAERVAAQIINSMNRTGCETRFLLIRAKRDEVVNTDLDDKTEMILLSEKLKAETLLQKLVYLPLRLYSTALGTLYEKRERDVPASVGWASVVWQYHREIRWMRDHLRQYPDLAVMVFLQPAIPIVMLAAEGLPNRVIFSERADPERLMKKRYGRRFIEKYYTRADAAVFQTEAAKAGYPDNIAAKGTVIPNPLKPGLPDRYTGERSKRIVTFCRISKQKNLPLAIRAFALFSESHPEYTFAVYGDALYEEGLGVERECKKLISELNLADKVSLLPFTADIHREIIGDCMYINSSDFEGISNAMLEAMAIGLPVVCTDCPAYGARSVIRNGENGIIVPMNDPGSLSRAMAEIADDPEFAESLSKKACSLRDKLSVERITSEWLELL